MDEWYHLSNKENSVGPSIGDIGCSLCGQSFDGLEPLIHHRFVCSESDGLNLVQRFEKLESRIDLLMERINDLETSIRQIFR